MATIDDLTTRIEVATVTLEADVVDITAFKGSLQGAVTAAELAETNAQSYATQAQSEVDTLLALKPVFKGEYGLTVDKSAIVTLTSASDFESAYGQVYKMKIGATGLVLNGLPAALVEGWHMYLFNASGTDITVSGSQAVAGDFLIPDGHIARVNRSTAPEAFRVYDITTGTTGGVLLEATLLNAASVAASQLPTALDTPLQLEAGPAQGTVSDPVQLSSTGLITFHQAGQYRINYTTQFGRTGAGAASILFTRFKINGVIVGNSRFAKIDNADIILPFSTRFVVNANAGDTLTFELVRDSAGVNSGGLYRGVPTLAGSPAAPSFALTVGRLQGTVDPSSGATNFVELSDVPSSYTGQAGKVATVNALENGLEFTTLTGAVDSVNGQTGVVVLDAADVGALPSTYVQEWDTVANKPSTFPPSVHVHAASDITSGVLATARLGTGTATASKVLLGNGTWGDAPAGAAAGFAFTETLLTISGVAISNWPHTNPNKPADLTNWGYGGTITEGKFFSTSADIAKLPDGDYIPGVNSIATGQAIKGMLGVIRVRAINADGTNKRAWFYPQPLGSDNKVIFYVYSNGKTNWIASGLANTVPA